MKILEVTNLCKTYGKGDTMVKALDNVSFSVEKGEFLAIIGPRAFSMDKGVLRLCHFDRVFVCL